MHGCTYMYECTYVLCTVLCIDSIHVLIYVYKYKLYNNIIIISVALLLGDVLSYPSKLKAIREQIIRFMNDHIFPNEDTLNDHASSSDKWRPHPLIQELKVVSYFLPFQYL